MAEETPSASQLLTEEERAAFLEFMAEHRGSSPEVSIRAGCEHALGLPITPLYQRMAHPPGEKARVRDFHSRVNQLIAREPRFAEQYRETRGYAQDQIRQKINNRIDGYEEVTTIVHPDGQVERRTVVKVDNRLLALQARAYLPEYGDHATIELTGAGGGVIQVEDRSAKLADVFAVLAAAGSAAARGRDRELEDGGGDARRALPGPPAVLAAPADDEPATDGVSSAP